MKPVKRLTGDESQLLGDLSIPPVLRKLVMDSMLVLHTFDYVRDVTFVTASHFIIVITE